VETSGYINLNKKSRRNLRRDFKKSPYSELSPFTGLLSLGLASVDLLSFTVLSLLLESAFFTLDVSPEGDL
jgi:hypothetical protein